MYWNAYPSSMPQSFLMRRCHRDYVIHGYMKVFYDYQVFSLQRRGGVSRYFLTLWQEFRRTGALTAELFLGLNQTSLGAEIADSVALRGFRATDRRVPKTRWLMWAINGALCQRALRRSDAEIYHPTYFWLPKDLGRKALVLTVYDLVHELFPHLFIPKDYVFRWRPSAVRRADVIIAISETTKRDLCARYDIPPERVFVTHLGCSLPAPGKLPASEVGAKPSLLYVGERGGYKNFAVVMAAWRQSEWLRQRFKLVCFGGGNPDAAERSMPGVVEFRWGDDLALGAAYREASALIYPSLYEGFGLPIVEAFNYGCPVVTSGCGSIREVAGEAAAYFDPASPEMLVTELRRLSESAAWHRELVERGQRRAPLFSWERCAAGTLEAYRAALVRSSERLSAMI